MRLVVDTNIFVSLLIRPGERFALFTDYLDQHATLLYSLQTMTELTDVLRRQKFSKYTSREEVAALVEWVLMRGELVTVEDAPPVSRDPTDDKFIALAVAGQADYIISGDKDLLVLGQIGAIPILSPAAFLALASR